MRRLLAMLVLLAAGCGGGAIPHPTDQHAARVRGTWPTATRSSLERGRELYVARCSGCHPLHPPSSYPAERWTVLVGEMADRARLDDVERDLVLRYLTALSAP